MMHTDDIHMLDFQLWYNVLEYDYNTLIGDWTELLCFKHCRERQLPLNMLQLFI